MNKRDYYLTALKAGRYLKSDWVFTAYSKTKPITEQQFRELNPLPFDLIYVQEGFRFFDPDKADWSPIDDVQGDILFHGKEPIELQEGDVLLPLNGVTQSTYGRVLANYVLIYFPFKGMMPYLNDRFSGDKLEKTLAGLIHDNPKDGLPQEPGKIYVSHYLAFTQAYMHWLNFTQLFVPGDTAKSLQTHPDMAELKKKLLIKYAGKLHDQSILAEFEAELEALDMEWLKDDPSLGLWTSEKDHKVVRKKLHRTMGHEQGFSDSVEANPIINSLYEGWDLSRFTDYNDGSRAGTYGRGSQTSKGGELVKWLLRASGTVNILAQDCGTRLGMRTEITDKNIGSYIGFSYVSQSGKAVLITNENAPKLVGRRIIVRSMMYCSLPDTNRCEVCAGSRLAENPTGASSSVTTMGDIIMNSFMKSMHGTVLSTTTYDPELLLC